MNDHSEWVQAIGEAISLVGCDDFYASLCGAFTRTPRISHPMLLYFPDVASLHLGVVIKAGSGEPLVLNRPGRGHPFSDGPGGLFGPVGGG